MMPKNQNSEKWSELEKNFDELIECSPQSRQRKLDSLRQTDPELADELAQLIRHDAALQESKASSAEWNSSNVSTTRFYPSQTVDRFRLLFPAHVGNQSEVWCATLKEKEQDKPSEKFAIKFLNLDSGKNNFERRLSRFNQEIELLAGLNHPNIAPLVGSGQTESGDQFLVTPWISGLNILAYCDRHQQTIRQRAHLLLKVMDAIAFAHQSLVVHRDIKPDNILVDESGQPILLDFGIAKLLEPDHQIDNSDRENHLTATIDRPMTLAYCSPEQIKGEPITTATDSFQCGLLAYELLTGHHPYSEIAQPEIGNIYDRVTSGNSLHPSIIVKLDATPLVSGPDKPARINAQLNAGWRSSTPTILSRKFKGALSAIILRAIEKDSPDRFSNVAELSQDLRNWLRNKPISTKTGSFSATEFIARRPMVSLVTAVATTAILSGILCGIIWNNWAKTEREKSAALALATDRAAKIDQLLRVDSGENKFIAEIVHFVSRNDRDRATAMLQSTELDSQQLSLSDRIQLAESCLSLGKISKGLKILSDVRIAGADALTKLEPKIQHRTRIVMTKLLLTAGWPFAASHWIEIPSEGEEATFKTVATLRALELATAVRIGHLEFAKDKFPEVLSPKVLYSLDQSDQGMIKIAHAMWLGLQDKWEQANKILNLDSESIDGHESDLIWYAEALAAAASQPSLEKADAELLLRRSLDAMNKTNPHHPRIAGIYFRLAELSNDQEENSDSALWLELAANQIKDHSEWGTRVASDLVEKIDSLDSTELKLDLFDWLNQLRPYRIANGHYPYLNAAIADIHLRIAEESGRHDTARQVAHELQSWLEKTEPIDKLYLLFSAVGQNLGDKPQNGLSTQAIESLYADLLIQHDGPAHVLLLAARDKATLQFKSQMQWLRLFLTHRNSEHQNQLQTMLYLAEDFQGQSNETAKMIASELEPYISRGDESPNRETMKWYKLMSLTGNIGQIEKELNACLQSETDEVKDYAAEAIVIGLVRSKRVSEAMEVSKQLLKENAPATSRLRTAIWYCDQWLKSANHELAEDWSKL